jgi:hypothetical protein
MKTIIECASWSSESYTPEISFLVPNINHAVRTKSKLENFKNQIKQSRGRLPVINGICTREWIKNL